MNLKLEKLLTAGFATALGASFIAAIPADARNGWIKITENTSGKGYYIRDVQCGGPICKFDFQFDGGNGKDTGLQVNCNNWTHRFRNVSGTYKGMFKATDNPATNWETISPGTVHNAAAEHVCR